MSEKRVLQTVAVYLKGDDLIPEEITEYIGFEPTESHRCGDKIRSSAGREIVKRTGLWKLGVTVKSVIDLPLLLMDVTSKILKNGHDIKRLPGVEEAFIDIFIAQMAEQGGGTCEFALDASVVAALQEVALPIQFTMAIVPGDEEASK